MALIGEVRGPPLRPWHAYTRRIGPFVETPVRVRQSRAGVVVATYLDGTMVQYDGENVTTLRGPTGASSEPATTESSGLALPRPSSLVVAATFLVSFLALASIFVWTQC